VSYNLLEEPWIPVLWKDGHSGGLGIIAALEQAARIRQIAANNPMDRLAILRFLLALLYWCRGNPSDDRESITSFPSDWFKTLDEKKDCFNLLGEGGRFYQYKRGGEEKKSANYLVQEVPTGTSVRHFRHSTDYQDGLCPACCATGLLRLPAFATQGGQGKSPGINQKPPVYVLPVGGSLAETLRLSWREVTDPDLGVPAWEKPDLNLPEHGNVPLLVGLTWLPRRVWLDDPGEPEGNCIACARRGMLIRRCVFAGLGSSKAAGRVWKDPHTIGEGDAVVRPSDALSAPDAAAGGWARLVEGILSPHRPSDKGRLWIVGFATDQNKFIEATEMEISLQEGLGDPAAGMVKTWESEVRRLGFRLRRIARGERKPRKDDARVAVAATASVRPNVESRVLARLRELMAGGDAGWQDAAREYTPMMAAVAESLSPGYTAAALRRQREIASLMPNMRTKAAAERAGRKKGGDP
jgi:hypothetical protein